MARYYTTPFVRWQLQSELQYVSDDGMDAVQGFLADPEKPDENFTTTDVLTWDKTYKAGKASHVSVPAALKVLGYKQVRTRTQRLWAKA